jgi:hypothetical protein
MKRTTTVPGTVEEAQEEKEKKKKDRHPRQFSASFNQHNNALLHIGGRTVSSEEC